MQVDRQGWALRWITRSGGPGGPIALGGVKADPAETERNPKPKTLHPAKSRRLIQFECRAGEFCFRALLSKKSDNGFSNRCYRTVSGHIRHNEGAAGGVKCQSREEGMGIAKCLRFWLSFAGEAPPRQRALRCGLFNPLNSAHARSSTPRCLPAIETSPCHLPSARATPAPAVKPNRSTQIGRAHV